VPKHNQKVQECDARNDESSNDVGDKKIIWRSILQAI